MTTNLTGQTALVTGATSGIGRATAELLGRRGAHVIVTGRSVERGDKVVATIKAEGGTATFIAADLNGARAAASLAAAARSVTGQVDIVINNAGIFPIANTAGTSEELFDTVYAVNVKGPLFLVADLATDMVERGAGNIVNISTAMAEKGMPGAAAYLSSKAAINQLTRIWAAEYGPAGVRVNAIVPGAVETEGLVAEFGTDRDMFLAVTPLGRVASPEDIANVIAFVVSEEAAFVHGAFYPVDGGTSAL
jgi:NAD(P)-dependent dehydrogenase (short-subunit alcohol dehydrogenase family)